MSAENETIENRVAHECGSYAVFSNDGSAMAEGKVGRRTARVVNAVLKAYLVCRTEHARFGEFVRASFCRISNPPRGF
jgi:hypothetical protein